MDLIKEIEKLKAEFMAPYAAANPDMANVTLRLFGHLLGEYDEMGWEDKGKYHALTNAHLLRVLHAAGIKLNDRWNYATSNAGGNLRHVYRFLLDQFEENIDDTAISHWSGDDYWDDCYILLALLEGRRGDSGPHDSGYDETLSDDLETALKISLAWMADHAIADFPNAVNQEWFGPGFHAAALHLFDVAARENLFPGSVNVIDKLAANLDKILQADIGREERWDPLFAWHIGQVIEAWSELSPRYPSLQALKNVIYAYYAELIGPARRSGKAGWDNGGRLNQPDRILFGTARALAAAYSMEADPAAPVINDAHDFIIAQMETIPMLQGLKACVNVLETLQMKMQTRLPNAEVYLTLQIGARLTITGLYDAVLEKTERLSARNKAATLLRVRSASRDALERSGRSALQPLGVNAELLKFATATPALLDQFHGERPIVKKQLETFLSAPMTEVRAKAARLLLRDLWTRPGLLHYVPFFDHLANLEHMQSFFSAYRDHVNHQILVFLFGAYMYYNDSRLRDNVLEEIAWTNGEYVANLPVDDDEFLFRWKMAATFHDVGYLFEVSPPTGDPGAVIESSLQFIQKWIDDFLFEYLLRFNPANVVGAKEAVQRIEPDLPKYGKPVKRVEDVFELLYSAKGNAFATMSWLLPDHLGKALLPNYFGMCKDIDPNADPTKKRKRFHDHGVMSAAILLKTADVQHDRLRAASRSR